MLRAAQIRLAFHGLLREAPIKPVYPPTRVEHPLLASIKRMAIRADIHLHVAGSGPRGEGVAAAAADGGSDVLGMTGLFHNVLGWAAATAAGGKGGAKMRFGLTQKLQRAGNIRARGGFRKAFVGLIARLLAPPVGILRQRWSGLWQ